MDWLIPCNLATFRLVEAFEKLETIDWRQSAKIELGDNVYIYGGVPIQCVLLKTEVINNNIPSFLCDNSDEGFSLGNGPARPEPEYYMRLKARRFFPVSYLNLNDLKLHGLKVPPQGPMRIIPELLEYIHIKENALDLDRDKSDPAIP